MENRFPEELSRLPQWVCWRLEQDKKTGRTAKVPYSPKTGYKASSNSPNTWGKLDEALLYVDKYMFAGVGFVFTQVSGIVGIDIDHCIEDGKLNIVASDILSHLPPTYIEISPSGKGLHIFLRGALPPGGNKNSKTGVEMYASNRYFTMTGNRFQGAIDSIAFDSGGVLEYIHQKYIATSRKSTNNQSFQAVSSFSDEEVLRLAQDSKDGSKFLALWSGNGRTISLRNPKPILPCAVNSLFGADVTNCR
jgi:primase-polymerase (primpol)-like protein